MRVLTAWAGTCCLVAVGCGGAITVDVPESAIQSSVEEYFPIDSDDLSERDLPVAVVLSDPKVVLDETGDRMGLDVHVAAKGQELPAPAPAAKPAEGGGPLLLPPGGAPVPPARPETAFDGTLTVFGDLAYVPDEAAFYYRNPTVDLDSAAEVPEPIRASVKSVVEKLLAEYLAKNSVYTLSDEQTSGRTARLLLKGIRVEGGTLKVELGP